MAPNITLLSNEELLTEETVIKNKLSILDSTQPKLTHPDFVTKRTHLDNRLEAILSEINKRETI